MPTGGRDHTDALGDGISVRNEIPTIPEDLAPSAVLCQRCDTTATFPYTPREYVAKALWFFVQATLFRLPLPRMSGRRRFLLRCFGAAVDPTVNVAPTVTVWHPWLLWIGPRASLARGVFV